MECESCKKETMLFFDDVEMKKMLDKTIKTVSITGTCYLCEKEQTVLLNRKSLILPKELNNEM